MWTLKIFFFANVISSALSTELSCYRHPELEHVLCQLNEKVNKNDILEVNSYKSFIDEDLSGAADLVLIYRNLPLHMIHGVGNIFGNLASFDLSSSNVKFFDKQCFKGMEKLKFLRLSHNEIEILPLNVFQGLVELDHLDLSRNKISVLPSAIFSANVNLRYLKLSENQLEQLDSVVFNKNLGLRKLFLNGNMLKRVSVDFSVFRGLTFLDLIGNFGSCNFRFNKKEMERFSLSEISATVIGGCNVIL